jgi:hypothetical protein
MRPQPSPHSNILPTQSQIVACPHRPPARRRPLAHPPAAACLHTSADSEDLGHPPGQGFEAYTLELEAEVQNLKEQNKDLERKQEEMKDSQKNESAIT